MDHLGRMSIEHARISLVGDALMADPEAAMAANPDDMPADLKSRMDDYTAMMMAEVDRADTADPLPDEVQALLDAIENEDTGAVRGAAAVVDLNGRYGKFSQSPLYRAISSFEVGCAIPNLLLDLGADPTLGMADGYTPLHAVAGKHWRDDDPDAVNRLVQRLVEGGADLEARTTSYHWTPVQYAVSELEEVALRALLLAGAQVEPEYLARDAQSCVKGPSTLDESFAFPEVLAVLLEFGADPNRTDEAGQSAIVRLEQDLRRNQAHLAAVVGRGKTPDENELRVSQGYQTSLDLVRAAARRA